MNNKAIEVIVCVSILTLGAIPITSTSVLEDIEKLDSESYLLEKAQELADDNLTLPPEFIITFHFFFLS